MRRRRGREQLKFYSPSKTGRCSAVDDTSEISSRDVGARSGASRSLRGRNSARSRRVILIDATTSTDLLKLVAFEVGREVHQSEILSDPAGATRPLLLSYCTRPRSWALCCCCRLRSLSDLLSGVLSSALGVVMGRRREAMARGVA